MAHTMADESCPQNHPQQTSFCNTKFLRNRIVTKTTLGVPVLNYLSTEMSATWAAVPGLLLLQGKLDSRDCNLYHRQVPWRLLPLFRNLMRFVFSIFHCLHSFEMDLAVWLHRTAWVGFVLFFQLSFVKVKSHWIFGTSSAGLKILFLELSI